MRTSGASSIDRLLFVLPAVIFLGFFIWTYDDPMAFVGTCDRFLRHTWATIVTWFEALG